MKKLEDINALVGKTPLIKINYKFSNQERVAFFKAEWYNLTGSIKDRVALNVIKEAYADGRLVRGQEIVEVTSGNMGISLAGIGSYLGHKVTIFMPKTMSEERKKMLKIYNANLIETNSFEEAFGLSQKYVQSNNAFLVSQFENVSNYNAHRSTTGLEILRQVNQPITAFLAGVGTSGTLSGVGSLLKGKTNAKVIAVEPKSSLILSTGKSQGHHKIQGLSDNIIPKLYDKNLVDGIIAVSDEDAIAMSQKLAKELGLGVGISSGANFVGTVISGLNNVVSVFADDNKKYLSTQLSTPISTDLVDNIELLSYEIIKD